MAFWDTVLSSTNAKLYGRRLIPNIVDDNARMARFLHGQIGLSFEFKTVMYMGFPNPRTYIVLIAAMKTGHKVLFHFTNSDPGHANLIRQTNCTILLYTAGFPVSGIHERSRLEAVRVPELATLLDNFLYESFPYGKTYEEAKYDPCFVMHTSGWTGLPAPVMTFVLGALCDARRRNYLAWPISSSSEIGAGITDICFNNNITTALGTPEQATAEITDEMIRDADIDLASCVPATLEDLAKHPNVLAKMRGLKHIAYHVLLVSLMVSIETVTIVQHVTDHEDWSYIRPVAKLFELVYVFPHLLEHLMCDLYMKHPTKPHHWRHEGRKDDIIVFKNVHACLLVGTNKDKPAAIVELHPQYYTEDSLVQRTFTKETWPQARKANDVADTFGQLEQRYVVFAKKKKPFEMELKECREVPPSSAHYARHSGRLKQWLG
ncbi:hypothetical protein BU25DRAFT_430857 [Macroventuria anomochaeta]|uniref:Uncharacterized protein n=1 Tax=Macroventuria anomochaeta TaxID=301207 RepID=A0ACB6S3M5_9PLEO|nr:uncharacterized protein BU25DRAFT_430857 [Macroventuria anomochaeta]KAF2628558.1 hypothetical protein BU25DRAFT_430857 [Macroventuria anomochaeta]